MVSNRFSIIRINLLAGQSNRIKKHTIIKFVIVCNLPRVILLNSKDRQHLDSSMWIRDNNQDLNKLLDNHYHKHILLFITQQKCNKWTLVILLQWELMNICQVKQYSWLKTQPDLYNLCSNLAQSSSLVSRMVIKQ